MKAVGVVTAALVAGYLGDERVIVCQGCRHTVFGHFRGDEEIWLTNTSEPYIIQVSGKLKQTE